MDIVLTNTNRLPGMSSLQTERKMPLLWALLAFVVYLTSVIAGSVDFAWLRVVTGSVVPCIVAHNIVNLFSGLLSYWMLAGNGPG